LIEFRDEVYARLAADFELSGFVVTRATTASEAIGLYAQTRHSLVVANLDLPDQSGWLLVGKLHFIEAGVLIWLYKPHKTASDISMAKNLHLDELLDYGGDLLDLSDAILDLLAGRPLHAPCPNLFAARPGKGHAVG
jgi:hypothetical protein